MREREGPVHRTAALAQDEYVMELRKDLEARLVQHQSNCDAQGCNAVQRSAYLDVIQLQVIKMMSEVGYSDDKELSGC